MEIDRTELKFISYAQALASKVVGGIAGGGTALLTANPVLGAVVGASLAHTLESVGKEVIERNLTPRQELRAGRAIAIAFGRMREFERSGRPIRTDDFFVAQADGRAPSDEITEATLQAAIGSAEEKKVDFIATLLANIATNPSIDTATAHLLIAQADRLPYRSFILLKISADVDSFGFASRHGQTNPETGSDAALQALELEAYQLVQTGLIAVKDHAEADDRIAVLGPDDIEPRAMYLTALGRLLHDNLGLGDMEDGPQYRDVVESLRTLALGGRAERTLHNVNLDGGTF